MFFENFNQLVNLFFLFIKYIAFISCPLEENWLTCNQFLWRLFQCWWNFLNIEVFLSFGKMHWLKKTRFHEESWAKDAVIDESFHLLPFFLHLFLITTPLEEVKVLVWKQYLDSFGDQFFVQFFILLFKVVNEILSVVLNILARWNLLYLYWFIFDLIFG